MALRRAWGWARRDLGEGLSALDPSKLMIAPILFVAVLAVIDRAIYEIDRSLDPQQLERMTRL